MLYVLIGFLKESAKPIPQSVQVQTGDFVGQPFIKVHALGPLLDASSQKVGVMMIFEHETRAAAEEFAKTSPYIRAGLVKDWRLYEYDNEVG
jgi:hypothetical protein